MRFVARQGGWDDAAPYAVYFLRDGLPLSAGFPAEWLAEAQEHDELAHGGRTLRFVKGAKGDRLQALAKQLGETLIARGEPPKHLSISLPESPDEPPINAARAAIHGLSEAYAAAQERPELIELLHTRREDTAALEQAVALAGGWARREYTPPSSCGMRLFWWGTMLLMLAVIGFLSLRPSRMRARFRSPPVALAPGETVYVAVVLERLDADLAFSGLSFVWPPFEEVYCAGITVPGDSQRVEVPLVLPADAQAPRGPSVRGHVILSPSSGKPVTSFDLPLADGGP